MLLKDKQKIDLLLANDDFNKDVDVLRIKWTKGKILKLNDEEYGKWFQGLLNWTTNKPLRLYNDFYKDLDKLRKKFKLSDIWDRFLYHYILFGNREFTSYSGMINYKSSKNRNKRKLSIRILPNTTIKDIEHLWPLIKRYQEELSYYSPKRFKKIINLRRDKLIFDSKKQGLTCRQIVGLLKEQGYGGVSYDYVSKIVKRYKNQIKI